MASNLNNVRNIDYTKILDRGINICFYQSLTQKILDYIDHNDSASLDEILAYVGGGERRIVRLLNQMVNIKIIHFNKNRFFHTRFKKKCKIKISDVSCDRCESGIIDIEKRLKPLQIFMTKIVKSRPESTFIFDQRPVNVRTIVKRVGYLIGRNDLQNKKIAVIGDDDLTSIALAETRMAKEIVVFEIDERILNLINNISETYKFNIKVVKQDLLKTTPLKYLNYFDVFITDPTPTTKALSLFTTKGLEMLKDQQGKVGYISLYPSHTDMTISFQTVLSRMDLLITDLIPFFNQYEIINHTLSRLDSILLKKYDSENKSISFYEYLMRVETTEKSKPLSLNFAPSDILGKATRLSLNNSMNDPVLSKKTKPKFIDDYAQNLKQSLKRRNKYGIKQ